MIYPKRLFKDTGMNETNEALSSRGAIINALEQRDFIIKSDIYKLLKSRARLINGRSDILKKEVKKLIIKSIIRKQIK